MRQILIRVFSAVTALRQGTVVDLKRILFDVSDHVATITINRPDRLNATDDLARTELGMAWARVRDDPDIRVAIITGAGDRAFCAGQDIRATAEGGIRNKVPGSRLHHDVWKPVICALNGMVVGGALHQVADADLIIAAEHAELIDTHLEVGNVFALEPAVLLRRMPLSMVMQLALMTKQGRISAQRGYEIGLINEVVPARAAAGTGPGDRAGHRKALAGHRSGVDQGNVDQPRRRPARGQRRRLPLCAAAPNDPPRLSGRDGRLRREARAAMGSRLTRDA